MAEWNPSLSLHLGPVYKQEEERICVASPGALPKFLLDWLVDSLVGFSTAELTCWLYVVRPAVNGWMLKETVELKDGWSAMQGLDESSHKIRQKAEDSCTNTLCLSYICASSGITSKNIFTWKPAPWPVHKCSLHQGTKSLYFGGCDLFLVILM